MISLARLFAASIAAVLLTGASFAMAAEEDAPNRRPVKAVADSRLIVAAAPGQGVLPLYVSRDWSKPLPEIDRAIVVIHGRLRDADVYYASARTALSAAGKAGAGTLLIVPQFLADIDVPAHGVPAETLRWSLEGWEGGEDAHAPAPLSSFDALDGILARLADRTLFPNLHHVVVAGHSGGGQVVQRYAILATGEGTLAAAGIPVRYVVANPSSYAYFTADRPNGQGSFGPFAGATACPGYDRWKYGMQHLPRYAGGATPATLESGYIGRDVVYLLGTADTNPQHPALDRTCMAEALGPYRYIRGKSYYAYLAARHPTGLRHRLWEVEGVPHDGNRMLTSSCGIAALFDSGSCAGAR